MMRPLSGMHLRAVLSRVHSESNFIKPDSNVGVKLASAIMFYAVVVVGISPVPLCDPDTAMVTV